MFGMAVKEVCKIMHKYAKEMQRRMHKYAQGCKSIQKILKGCNPHAKVHNKKCMK